MNGVERNSQRQRGERARECRCPHAHLPRHGLHIQHLCVSKTRERVRVGQRWRMVSVTHGCEAATQVRAGRVSDFVRGLFFWLQSKHGMIDCPPQHPLFLNEN